MGVLPFGSCRLQIAHCPHGTAIVLLPKTIFMKGKYFAAAGLALAGFVVYYFLNKRKNSEVAQPQNENERHHLTNAFAKAKQVAVGR